MKKVCRKKKTIFTLMFLWLDVRNFFESTGSKLKNILFYVMFSNHEYQSCWASLKKYGYRDRNVLHLFYFILKRVQFTLKNFSLIWSNLTFTAIWAHFKLNCSLNWSEKNLEPSTLKSIVKKLKFIKSLMLDSLKKLAPSCTNQVHFLLCLKVSL